MKKLLLLSAAVLAMQALPALAEDTATTTTAPVAKEGGMKPHDGMFEKGDTNKDGVISQDEFLAHAKERFNDMDANHDGKITKDEAKAHHEAMKGKWAQKMQERKAAKEGTAAPAAQ